MIAKREVRKYSDDGTVWVGKYKNSHNSLHWHPDCELLCVERGSIDVLCEGKTFYLTVGQSLFIDSEQIHSMCAREPETVLIVLIFNPNIVKRIQSEFCLACPVLQNDYRIPTLYQNLYRIFTKKAPLYDAEAACNIMQLMIEIYRNEELKAPSAVQNSSSQTFKRLLEEMNERCDSITFREAAAFMNMSEAYFSRYFRAAAGITFSRQLNYLRTDAAVRMLHEKNELSVTEIAECCGFTTIRNFNRIFKELTGYSPSSLPDGYVFDAAPYADRRASDPTLFDCRLIESPFVNEVTSS